MVFPLKSAPGSFLFFEKVFIGQALDSWRDAFRLQFAIFDVPTEVSVAVRMQSAVPLPLCASLTLVTHYQCVTTMPTRLVCLSLSHAWSSGRRILHPRLLAISEASNRSLLALRFQTQSFARLLAFAFVSPV